MQRCSMGNWTPVRVWRTCYKTMNKAVVSIALVVVVSPHCLSFSSGQTVI